MKESASLESSASHAVMPAQVSVSDRYQGFPIMPQPDKIASIVTGVRAASSSHRPFLACVNDNCWTQSKTGIDLGDTLPASPATLPFQDPYIIPRAAQPLRSLAEFFTSRNQK